MDLLTGSITCDRPLRLKSEMDSTAPLGNQTYPQDPDLDATEYAQDFWKITRFSLVPDFEPQK